MEGMKRGLIVGLFVASCAAAPVGAATAYAQVSVPPYGEGVGATTARELPRTGDTAQEDQSWVGIALAVGSVTILAWLGTKGWSSRRRAASIRQENGWR